MFLERSRYRPRYIARLVLRKMRGHIAQVNSLMEKMSLDKDRAAFAAKLTTLDGIIQKLFDQFGLPSSGKVSKLKKSETDSLLSQIRGQIDRLLSEVKAKLSEQERLKKLQEALELERKK